MIKGAIITARQYTKDEINYILNSKLTSTELSKETGFPASSITSIRNANGIYSKKVFNPLEEEFINIYDELKSSIKVGKYFGVDHSTVIRYAKRIGYDYKSKTNKVSEEQKQYIVNNYNNKSSTALSEELGINKSTINGIWYRNNLSGKTNRVYTLDETTLDKIDTEEKAYFLGFFSADGCVSKNDKKQDTISFSLHKQDSYILEKFYKLFGSDKNISTNHKGYVRFEISSNHICEQIYKLGFTPRKTYSNTFCLLDKHLMHHYLRGYFDGDGSIGENALLNKNSLIISGYESNMNKISEFLLKEKHISSSFNWDKRKVYIEDDNRFGALVFTNKLNKYCFLKYIYADASIYLDRKYEKSMKFIEEIEKEERVSHTDIVNYYKYAVQTA